MPFVFVSKLSLIFLCLVVSHYLDKLVSLEGIVIAREKEVFVK